MSAIKLIPVFCCGCGKLMLEAEEGATVRVKHKCGTMNMVTVKKPEPRNFSGKMDNITKKRASA